MCKLLQLAFKWIAEKIASILLFISALLLLGGSFYLLTLDKVAAASTSIAAAVFCLIFAFIYRFKRFKGFGVEAEMWEDTQIKAEYLVKRLENLSIASANPLFSLISHSGKWGSLPRKQKLENIERLYRVLEESGLSRDKIDDSAKDWHFVVLCDLANQILQPVMKQINSAIQDIHKELAKIKSPIDPSDPDYIRLIAQLQKYEPLHEASPKWRKLSCGEKIPDALNDFLRLYEKQIPDLLEKPTVKYKKELENLQHYAHHHEFVEKEIWLRGEQEAE